MKKHIIKIITITAVVLLLLCGCGTSDDAPITENKPQVTETATTEQESIVTQEETSETKVDDEKPEEKKEESAPLVEEEIKTEEPLILTPHEKPEENPEVTLYETESEVENFPSEEEPLPDKTEPEQAAEEKINSVSLTVDASDILNNIEALKKEKCGIVPDSGIMFSASGIEVNEGESVFEILKRELIKAGVHLEFNLAPVTKSAYIEGIGNIYEFDCGERSGWKYSVNGEYPRVGCSDYKVKPGDKIVFVYKIKAY